MTLLSEPHAPRTLARIAGLILRPAREWRAIADEPIDAPAVFVHHVLPLAAIGPLAHLVRGLVFGLPIGDAAFPAVPVNALVGALVGFSLNLIGLELMVRVVHELAPAFGANKSRQDAFKVAVYSVTAAWLASAFVAVPGLRPLGVLGVYSFWLLFLGLKTVFGLRTRPALLNAGIVFCVGVLMAFVASVTAAQVSRLGLTPPLGSGVSIPIAQPKVRTGPPTATMGEQLQTLLPGELDDDFQAVETHNGVSARQAFAERTYAKGDMRVTLKVSDLGLDVTAPTAASPDPAERQSRRVAGRYQIEARGQNAPSELLSAAMAKVDAERLAAIGGP